MILRKIGKKITRLAEVLENPQLFIVRWQGISIDGFVRLNQPWLTEAGINTVLDIGANVGQFAKLIHKVLPTAMIYSFEPLGECYEELKKRMQKVDGFRAFNTALGDANGDLEFHRNEFSPSSSALPMSDLHIRNYPFTAEEQLIKVRSVKLDDMIEDLKIVDNLLIKIDVQGFEHKVISGGRNTVRLATILIIETSFQSLYVGQPLFEDVYDLLREDFRYMGALEQSQSLTDGSVLYEDSIFVKKGV